MSDSIDINAKYKAAAEQSGLTAIEQERDAAWFKYQADLDRALSRISQTWAESKTAAAKVTDEYKETIVKLDERKPACRAEYNRILGI